MSMTFPELPLAWLPLADAVVKATLVLTMAAAAAFALRRASAALRHLVWTVGLCSALALPLLTLSLPKWQMPIFSVAATPAAQPNTMRQSASEEPRTSPDLRPVPSRTSTATREMPVESEMTPGASLGVPAAQTITWQQALFATWLLGASVVFARLLTGLAAVLWLSRRTQRVTDAPWLPLARGLAAGLGVTPRLRFLRSGHATMPIAAGVFRPSVIMPADADTWPESRLRIVLLHELAHVKRRDCLTHLIAQAACALHWFNPLAWVAARRVRTERERACDDLVLASGTRGSDYADQLLEIARGMQSDRFPGLLAGASLAMAHRSQLEGRLIAILDPRVPRVGLSRARAMGVVALSFAAVAPLGALQPWTTNSNAAASAAVADVSSETTLRAVDPIATPNVQAATVSEPRAAAGHAQGQGRAPAAGRAQATVSEEAFEEAAPIARTIAESLGGRLADSLEAAAAEAFDRANPVQEPNPNQKQQPSQKPQPTQKPQPDQGTGRQADPRMVAALTAALKDTDKDVREAALHALVQLRDPAVFDPLMQALKDSSPDVREQAAFGLGQLRDRRAVPPLITSLKDENADVRERAAFALGQLRDPSSVEALAATLRDANADVREQAAFALSQIRDARSVVPLVSALKDENPDVREQAAFALSQIRDRSAVDGLVSAIKDPNADVREQVAFALGQIRDPRAIDALTGALKDQSADVRQQAAFALGQLSR
jgi:HEAT repeat protein/beta-lactamase regulating signal transducer with metallopeptidase domain